MESIADDGGILVHIHGDYGPFSREGKSIGYRIVAGTATYLVDCGAPIFQQMGGHGLKNVRGILVTHCHDDHKRWFTDLALFKMYAPDVTDRVRVITTESVHRDLRKSARGALDMSLTADSLNVVDIPYSDYVDPVVVGPRARYRIARTEPARGRGIFHVVDREGNPVGPDRAKIVINPATERPRLLFKDPHYGEWIEPESFYPFSSEVFYEDRVTFVDDEIGLRISAIKSPVWHGLPTTGFRISRGDSSIVFSSDTVNNPDLWKRLAEEKRAQELEMSREEFDRAEVIYGDINRYIERTWSRERYEAALKAFDDAVVVHDVATRYSAVHTDYANLAGTRLVRERTLLTHSPDRIASEWPLGSAGKTFVVCGKEFYEVVGDRRYRMNAHVYFKDGGKYLVGYRNPDGPYRVFENEGILDIAAEGTADVGTPLYRIDLFEDLGGRYFPKIETPSAAYRCRPDGEVERVEWTRTGSRGELAKDLRPSLGLSPDRVRED